MVNRIEFRETAMNIDCLVMEISAAKDNLIRQGLAMIGLSYEWALENADRLNVISCGCTFGDSSEHYYIDNQLKFSILIFVDYIGCQYSEDYYYNYGLFLTFPSECNMLPIRERCATCLREELTKC